MWVECVCVVFDEVGVVWLFDMMVGFGVDYGKYVFD